MDRPLSLSSLPGTGVTGRTHLVEEGLEDTVPHSARELLYLDTDSRELSAGLENVRLSGDQRLGGDQPVLGVRPGGSQEDEAPHQEVGKVSEGVEHQQRGDLG